MLLSGKTIASALVCLFTLYSMPSSIVQQRTYTRSSIAWSPNSQVVAVAGYFGVKLFDANLTPLASQLVSPSVTNGLAWSADSTRLAGAGMDNQIYVWNMQTDALLVLLQGHTKPVNGVSWSPNGAQLASVSDDGVIRIWNTSTWSLQSAIQDTDAVNAVAWSPDSTRLAVTTNTAVEVWNPSNNSKTLTVQASGQQLYGSINWKSDGTQIVVNGPQVIDVASGGLLSIEECGSATASTWSRDGSRIAASGTKSGGADLCIIDALSRFTITDINLDDEISSIAFSPDGSKVAAAAVGGHTRIWDTVTGQQLSEAIPLPPSTLKLQYYPDPGAKGNITDGLMPDFNIVNTTGTAVPLNQLKIRYYFTRDTTDPSVTFRYVCSYTDLPNGCGGSTLVRGTVVKLTTPVTGADSYIEISFTGGTLAANSQTNEILSYVNKSDWSNYTQSNDYSFDGTRGEVFTDWNKATLYRNGVLIWGTEPQ